MNDGIETPADIEDARDRAFRAVQLSQGVANTEDLIHGEQYPIYDLITNLLHLGDRFGFDSDELIEQALFHYYAGRLDEN